MEPEDIGAGGRRRVKGGKRGGKGGGGEGNGQPGRRGVDPHGGGGGSKGGGLPDGGGGSKGGGLPGGGQSKMNPSSSHQAAGNHRLGGGGQGSSLSAGGKGIDTATKSLRDMIISWEVDDILADENKVPAVPGFHTCIQDYVTAYSKLLVQECRANVKDSLKKIKSSPSYNIEAILPTNSEWKHFIDIDLNLNEKGNYHVAREGDLFLFHYYSPQEPGENLSKEEPGEKYKYSHKSIGIASGISPHSKFHQGFTAYAPKNLGNFKYATFLTNMIDSLNVWDAMHLEKPEDNSSVINSIMKLTEPPNTECTHCPNPVGLKDLISNNLSEQQKSIVNSVAQAVKCKECQIVKLVSAPPGSGKTLIISEVLHILRRLSMKTLICVPTENDIISLLSTLEGSKYLLNDILVLDNLDDKGLNTKARQVCLVDRSHDFLCCIQMFKQLTHEMLLLLKLEMFCAKSCDHESSVRCSETGLPVFTLKIFRNNFRTLVTHLRHCLVDIKDRFSDMLLTKENISDIEKLLNKLKVLENRLEIQDEKSVLRAFGFVTSGQYTSGLCLAAEDLNRVRLACLTAVENLGGSVKLPSHFSDRTEVENYCIEKCQVIVSTVCSAFRLHKLNADQVDLFIVDDASNIREYDMIVPLRLSIRHVWMLADDNIPPLANKVAEKDGYSSSLFKRLSQLGFPVDKLTEKFPTVPAIFTFKNKHLFDANISDGELFKHMNPNKNNLFYDVGELYYNESIDSVEEDIIVDMLGGLWACWQDAKRKLEVAVVCLYSSRTDEVKGRLLNNHATPDRINLHVKCANALHEDMYDIIIMSALSKDHGTFVEDKYINSALTKARHFRWTLLQKKKRHDGIFKQLIDDAEARDCLIQLDRSLFSVKDHSGTTDTFANSPAARRVTTERTWQGRPYNTKDILGDLRDQKCTDTCTLHSSCVIVESLKRFQYAEFQPPKEFRWTLSADKLGVEFKKITDKDIGEEVDIAQKGCYRLETVQNILKETGAIGHKSLQTKEGTLQETHCFKIKSYSKLDIHENNGKDDALLAIRNGTVLSGYFRISRNYFSLKPGEIYHYDSKKPYLSPLYSLPASHVVMMIGSGVTDTSTELPSGDVQHEKEIHVNFQNSAGKLFGDGGFGKIGSRSVRGMYQMTV